MTVPEFPNFFMLYGPNTNLVINGSIIVMVECQVRYIVESLGQLVRGRHRTMSCRPEVHDVYNAEIEAGNEQMAWGVADVPSWYRNERGRVTQNWPFDLLDYWRAHQPAHTGRLRADVGRPCPVRSSMTSSDSYPRTSPTPRPTTWLRAPCSDRSMATRYRRISR